VLHPAGRCRPRRHAGSQAGRAWLPSNVFWAIPQFPGWASAMQSLESPLHQLLVRSVCLVRRVSSDAGPCRTVNEPADQETCDARSMSYVMTLSQGLITADTLRREAPMVDDRLIRVKNLHQDCSKNFEHHTYGRLLPLPEKRCASAHTALLRCSSSGNDASTQAHHTTPAHHGQQALQSRGPLRAVSDRSQVRTEPPNIRSPSPPPPTSACAPRPTFPGRRCSFVY
jgi:hypothetical protein